MGAAIPILAVAAGVSAAGSIYYGHKQYQLAKEQSREAKRQYTEQQQALKAEKKRLENLEAERKKRLTAMGRRTPKTILTSFGGIQDEAMISKKQLLGA